MFILVFLLGLAFGQDVENPTINWEELTQSVCTDAKKPKHLVPVAYMISEFHTELGLQFAGYHTEITKLYTDIQREEDPYARPERVRLSVAITVIIPIVTKERMRLKRVGSRYKGDIRALQNGLVTDNFGLKGRPKKREISAACSYVMTKAYESIAQAIAVRYKCQQVIKSELEAYEEAKRKYKEREETLEIIKNLVLDQPLDQLPDP